MNEFERAIAKTEKREQRKTLTLPPKDFVEKTIEIPVPKEKKPSIDGIIKVSVVLPYDEFEMIFIKPNVMGMKRITKAEFQRAIFNGLKPLLGDVR